MVGMVGVMMSGCRLVKAPASPYEAWIPPSNDKTQQTVDPSWTEIRQQRTETNLALALMDLADIALRNSPSTREAWENARSSQASVDQAASAVYPQLTATGTGTRQKTTANVSSDESDYLTYGPGLQLSWLVYNFGGRAAAIEGANQLMFKSNYLFNKAIQDLLLAVAKNYYNLHSAQETLDAAQKTVDDARASLDAVKHKFEAGLAARPDVLQAQATYDSSIYTLESARGNIESARAMLAQSLGLSSDTPFTIAPPTDVFPTDFTRDQVSVLIETALKRRPDVASMRANVHAREAYIQVQSAALWPSLNVSGSANRNGFQYYDDAHTQDMNNNVYMATLTASWTLFDGYSNLSKKRQAEADARAAREQLRSTEINASADVWTRYYAYQTAIRKLNSSQTYLDSSQASYDVTFAGYQSGLKGVLDLLQAQSTVSDARSKWISSKAALFNALADLSYSTGNLQVKDLRGTK